MSACWGRGRSLCQRPGREVSWWGVGLGWGLEEWRAGWGFGGVEDGWLTEEEAFPDF